MKVISYGLCLVTLFSLSSLSAEEGLQLESSLETEEHLQIIVKGLKGEELKNVQYALKPPTGLVREGKVDRLWLEHFKNQIPEKVRRALEPFGYYHVHTEVSLDPLKEGRWKLYVEVKPGKPVRLTSVELSIKGPGAEEKGLKDLVKPFPLKVGDILLHQKYEEAKGNLKAEAQILGYLDAEFSVHVIRVFRKEYSAEIELVLDTGPRYYFGETRILGASEYPERFLRRYIVFHPGEIFSYYGRGGSPFFSQRDSHESVNLNIDGYFHSNVKDTHEGRIFAKFKESYFKGHSFQGNLELSLKDSIFHIQQAKFKGKGFSLVAGGSLQKGIQFRADIGDLYTLIPGGKGVFFAKGWGRWSKGHFEREGEIKIFPWEIMWRHKGGTIKAIFRSANLNWDWKEDTLKGEIAFNLLEYGHMKGHVELPLPARFPVAVQSDGLLRLSVEGEFREKGVLPAFLPGVIQESQGQIHFFLSGEGPWKNPDLEGTIKLSNAETYIPGLGIRLKEFRMEAKLKKDEIRITSFQTQSGDGKIEGEATIKIKDWRVSRYQGRLYGERFKTIHLPELQVLSNPRIVFHGTPQKIFVKGEIRLPEVLITGPPTREGIRPSPDVVIVDALEVEEKRFPFSHDIQIRVLLGERVFVKSHGIEARLVGSLSIQFQDPSRMNAEGEIRVAEGHYSAYGQRLEIIRGRLLFTGGPVENPTIDALAVRKIEEIRAGVVISGSLKKPIVRLYSRPPMPDTDILSYIILGQPLGHGAGAVPSLMQAAAALLSAGESVVLPGRFKKLFGLDTLDITTPPGEGEVSRSMVTVGKFLTPKLYISLGRSLYTDSTLLTFRYTLSKRLEIQATTGTESGATLFYKIEFR